MMQKRAEMTIGEMSLTRQGEGISAGSFIRCVGSLSIDHREGRVCAQRQGHPCLVWGSVLPPLLYSRVPESKDPGCQASISS